MLNAFLKMQQTGDVLVEIGYGHVQEFLRSQADGLNIKISGIDKDVVAPAKALSERFA